MSSSLSIKSNASGGVLGKTDSNDCFSFSGSDLTYLRAYSFDMRPSVD